MDVEKAIKFLVEHQARFDARMEANFLRAEDRFARADERFAKAEGRSAKSEARLDRVERVLTQTNRVLAQLAAASLKARNELRQRQIEADREIKALREHAYETDDKLNALIDLVDKSIRRNDRRNGPNHGRGNRRRGGPA